MTVLLQADEQVLEGRWVSTPEGLRADAVSDRIDRLVREHLVEVATDTSGWDVLYRDPRDGRLWELTRPSSDSHGGGAARLEQLAPAAAAAKYAL